MACSSLSNSTRSIASRLTCPLEAPVHEIAALSLALRVRQFKMLVELSLNTFLKLFAIRSMPGATRPEGDGRTRAATGFHRNVAEPFRNPDGRLFHLRLVF